MNEFLNKLQAKIRQLMWGRYGNDELSLASLGLAFILLLINTFIKGNNFLMVPVEVILIWVIFRSFSKKYLQTPTRTECLFTNEKEILQPPQTLQTDVE